MKNEKTGWALHSEILEKLSTSYFKYDQSSMFPKFVEEVIVKEIIANHTSSLVEPIDNELKWCGDERKNCSKYLAFAFEVFYFPFELIKYRQRPLGFGSFVVQFKSLLNDLTGEAFANQELNYQELKVREYIAKVWDGFVNQTDFTSTKMTPYDMVQLIHANIDDTDDTFAKPIQYDFDCWNRNHLNGEEKYKIKELKKAWENWSNGILQSEPPCLNDSVDYFPCCQLSNQFLTNIDDKLVPTLLKIMKYAVQPITAFIPKVAVDLPNLEFLSYNIRKVTANDPGNWRTQINHNSRIPMCGYAKGNLEKEDWKTCDMFHLSMTDEGIGYTFNGINFWNLMKATKYMKTFASIMKPKGTIYLILTKYSIIKHLLIQNR